jgi:hypothetical protein
MRAHESGTASCLKRMRPRKCGSLTNETGWRADVKQMAASASKSRAGVFCLRAYAKQNFDAEVVDASLRLCFKGADDRDGEADIPDT